MDDKQLIDFVLSGGDVSSLSDQDAQRAYGLLQSPQQGETANFNMQPEAPRGLLHKPGESVPGSAPMDIGATPPKEFLEWFLSSIAQTGALGAGMAIPGFGVSSMAKRLATTMPLGGAAGALNPDEGQTRTGGAVEGALTQAAAEGTGSALGKLVPAAATRTALWMGVPKQARLDAGGMREMADAFLRTRQKQPWGMAPAVGRTSTLVREGTSRGPLLPELQKAMGGVKAELPARITPLSKVEQAHVAATRQPGGLRDPLKYRASNRPKEAAEFVDESDRDYFDQHRWLQSGMQQPPARPGSKALVPDPKMNFGDLVEMSQGQSNTASDIYKKMARGQWTMPGDEAGAALARKKSLRQSALDTATQQPGGDKVVQAYDELNKRLHDAYIIEDVAKHVREGLAFTGIRGGLMSGWGRTASGVAGGGMIGGPMGAGIGGALSLAATPGNVYRTGSAIGRLGEVGPSTFRALQLLNGLRTDEGSPLRKPTPVRRRRPQ